MNLTFHNTKDKIPEHDSTIVYIERRDNGFVESFEFNFGRVEYVWDDGNGRSICYDKNDPERPESDDPEYPFRLMVLVDETDFGISVDKNKPSKTEILWQYYDKVFDRINKALS